MTFPDNTCPLCNKAFKRKDHVQRHYLELHLKHVAFECTKCKRMFKRKYLMENHEKICFGGASYQCIGCKTNFKNKEKWLAHMMKAHNINMMMEPHHLLGFWIDILFGSIMRRINNIFTQCCSKFEYKFIYNSQIDYFWYMKIDMNYLYMH